MRCDDARFGLSLRADGERPEPATDVVLDAHVADCPGLPPVRGHGP